MYYDDFEPSDGVWYDIQNMVKQVERMDSTADLAPVLRQMSDAEIRQQRDAFKEMLSNFSQVGYQLLSSRGVSHRISSLYDRQQKAESSLRSVISLLEKPVDRRTDEQRRADEKRARDARNERDYNEAKSTLSRLAKQSKATSYEELSNLVNEYDGLIDMLRGLDDYMDSKSLLRECKESYDVYRASLDKLEKERAYKDATSKMQNLARRSGNTLDELENLMGEYKSLIDSLQAISSYSDSATLLMKCKDKLQEYKNRYEPMKKALDDERIIEQKRRATRNRLLLLLQWVILLALLYYLFGDEVRMLIQETNYYGW